MPMCKLKRQGRNRRRKFGQRLERSVAVFDILCHNSGIEARLQLVRSALRFNQRFDEDKSMLGSTKIIGVRSNHRYREGTSLLRRCSGFAIRQGRWLRTGVRGERNHGPGRQNEGVHSPRSTRFSVGKSMNRERRACPYETKGVQFEVLASSSRTNSASGPHRPVTRSRGSKIPTAMFSPFHSTSRSLIIEQ